MGRWIWLVGVLVGALVGGCRDNDAHEQPTTVPVIPPLPPLPLPDPSESAVATVRPPTDGGPACGAKGLPDCPLQAWMKENMNPPMKAHDWQGMADSLEHAALLAPPDYLKTGYVNWVSIAKDGANAARAAELDAVKAACRGCHEQYKTKYRVEMRTRALP
jgi:hypothetical protein